MERREVRRTPCRATVQIAHRETGIDDARDVGDSPAEAVLDWFCLESTDISPGGVFLQTDLLLAVGERLALEFEVPGRSRAVRGRGEVVRVESADLAECGVAVRLDGLTAEERCALSRMSCEAIRPGLVGQGAEARRR